MPVMSKGSVDEALKNAGETLANYNRNAVADMIEQFVPMDDCRLMPFVESLNTLNVMHNREGGLLTDGENLYIREVE